MLVRRAKRSDLPQISALQAQYGKMSVGPELINHRDIAIVAEDMGRIVGFVYCGLMAQNTLGYVDKIVVDRDCAHKRVCQSIYKELGRLLVRMNVKTVFGIVKHDEFHDRAIMNALRMAMKGDAVPYTYIFTDVAHAAAELQALEN
jgi:N-acetylglutamate synthase-like GNAT family acetyltransferase